LGKEVKTTQILYLSHTLSCINHIDPSAHYTPLVHRTPLQPTPPPSRVGAIVTKLSSQPGNQSCVEAERMGQGE
jgi:hypothetical protein